MTQTERGIIYQDVGTYECARGHKWESIEGIIHPFQPRACPKCKCSSRLLSVDNRARGLNP